MRGILIAVSAYGESKLIGECAWDVIFPAMPSGARGERGGVDWGSRFIVAPPPT